MRHYVVTIPPAGKTILALGLEAAKQCLPTEAEIIAGEGEAFDRVAHEMGFGITRRDGALTDPKAYGRSVQSLLFLLKDGTRPRIVIAYPAIVDWLDGSTPGVPEAIYHTEVDGFSFRGLACVFRDGRQIGVP